MIYHFSMNALSTLTIMPENKESLALYISNLKSEILAGNENPLKIAKLLKILEEIVKTLRDDSEIKEIILKEAEKYKEKTIQNFGAEFCKKEAGIKYDYSECNDNEWNDLSQKIHELFLQKKEREQFLNKITPEITIFNNEGIRIEPPLKTSQTIVSISIK